MEGQQWNTARVHGMASNLPGQHVLGDVTGFLWGQAAGVKGRGHGEGQQWNTARVHGMHSGCLCSRGFYQR
jgi:hypothetical protein